ncbi:MAG TPA: hypothetical protein PLD30_07450, partial [Candidatus Competibacteraceae bacterium]|nr:hypothetical protein [Candidatus Competibacteraceae bacterium]
GGGFHPLIVWRFALHNNVYQPDITRPKLHFAQVRRLSAAQLDYSTASFFNRNPVKERYRCQTTTIH